MGALKENDTLAVRYADGEITESEMKKQQYLNGGIALGMTLGGGYAASAKAFTPIASATFKTHLAGGLISGGANIGIQYATTGKVDIGSAGIATGVGLIVPAYSYKGLMAISSTGVFIDQKILHDKSLVDTSMSMVISGATNSLGYGFSYVAINNKYVMPYLSQTYRNNLYSNGGYNYVHNYTTFKNSEVLSKAVVTANGLGGIGAEAINQGYSRDKNDEK